MTAAVLVLRRGGLGDTLLMLPVLRALRRTAPAAELHFAGVREFADVLMHFGAVDVAHSVEDLQLWSLGSTGAASQRAIARLARYRHIVADDLAVQAIADTPRVQVFDPRPARDDVPLALQIGAQLGLAVSLDDAWLRAPPRVTPRRSVVLAPGGSAAHKCWPRARWLELAALLAAAAVPFAVVVGPIEAERDDPRAWTWPAVPTFLCDLSCVQLAEQLADARAFVGNDSGPTHLAAALGVPTVAIFCSGEPRVFAPPGAHVRIVDGSRQGPPAASVAVVMAALPPG